MYTLEDATRIWTEKVDGNIPAGFHKPIRAIFYFLSGIAGTGAFFYPGTTWLYAIFCTVYTLVLRQVLKGTFSWFYFYFTVFMLLGYPVKLAFHCFSGLLFNEPVGFFGYKPSEYDSVIIVATLGGAGVFLAKIVSDRLPFWQKPSCVLQMSSKCKFSSAATVFVVLALSLTLINLIWGFFLVGLASKTVLPYKMTALVFWAFNFGLNFCLAYILRLPFAGTSDMDSRAYLAIFFGIIVSIAIFSRAPLIFVSIPMIVALLSIHASRLTFLRVTKYFGVWLISTAIALSTVSFLRSVAFSSPPSVDRSSSVISRQPSCWSFDSFKNFRDVPSNKIIRRYQTHLRQVSHLFLDRWIGLEGLAAVNAFPNKGWRLFKNAILEDPKTGINGIYQVVCRSPFLKMSDREKTLFRFGSEPGIMAFFLYSGAFWMVFLGVFGLVTTMLLVERASGVISKWNVYLLSITGCALANLLMQFTYVWMFVTYIVELFATLFMYRFIDNILSKGKSTSHGVVTSQSYKS